MLINKNQSISGDKNFQDQTKTKLVFMVITCFSPMKPLGDKILAQADLIIKYFTPYTKLDEMTVSAPRDSTPFHCPQRPEGVSKK